MAKKTHVKVRMVPEAKPDSPYFYYVKNKLTKISNILKTLK